MQVKTHELWNREDYPYPAIGDFVPSLTAYLHEDEALRPAILIAPGGGYSSVAPGEGEIVAHTFFHKGYQAFVVTYTTDVTMSRPLHLQPLRDLSRALLHLRKEFAVYHVRPEQCAVCGFSAGGHLAASLAVHSTDAALAADVAACGVSNRPDAVVLCYPVITSGKNRHQDSFIALCGREADEEELHKLSLEHHVSGDTPPAFLWHTGGDSVVPLENTLLFADACRRHSVPCEHHVFACGGHGMSVATKDWASVRYGGFYTFGQLYQALQYAAANGLPELSLPLPDPPLQNYVQFIEYMKGQLSAVLGGQQADEAIAMWPELAHHFLQKVFHNG